jgi:hypothetical protein
LHNGVNPVEQSEPLEWVRIRFDLINGGTLESVVEELNSGVFRIGMHIIDLPDGSSEGGTNVPEPNSIFLLAAFGVALARVRAVLKTV